MDQRVVAGFVAEPVVEALEIVDVEQTDRKRRFLALHAGDFAAQGLVQPLAVERVGQWIVPRQRAGAIQFAMQLGKFSFRAQDLLLQAAQLLARARRFLGHRAGGDDDILEQRRQFFDAFDLFDLAGAFLDLALEGLA